MRSMAASCLMKGSAKGNVALKKGFNGNIEKLTLANKNYRQVLYTGEHSQLVLMSLPPKTEIGLEVHDHNDQFFRFESGKGVVRINDNKYNVSDGSAVVIPRGAQHNVINVSDTEPLQLYSVYSPAHHVDGLVEATKEDADLNEEAFDGVTTE